MVASFFFCHRGRTFFIGDVGLVTWFVGLVGGDTVLVEVVVVLLLTDADGLVFSKNQKTTINCLQPLSVSSLAAAHTHTVPASVSDSESSSSSSSLEQLDSSFFPSSSSSTFSGSKVSMRGVLFSGSRSSVSLLKPKYNIYVTSEKSH